MARGRKKDTSYAREITPFIDNEVIFTKKLMREEYLPIPFDPDMRATVLSIEPDEYFCSNIWYVKLDISRFEEENKEFGSANHGNNKYWWETDGYPKDGVVNITVYGDDLPFKLVRF